MEIPQIRRAIKGGQDDFNRTSDRGGESALRMEPGRAGQGCRAASQLDRLLGGSFRHPLQLPVPDAGRLSPHVGSLLEAGVETFQTPSAGVRLVRVTQLSPQYARAREERDGFADQYARA